MIIADIFIIMAYIFLLIDFSSIFFILSRIVLFKKFRKKIQYNIINIIDLQRLLYVIKKI
jgi:hypothetical protein